MELTSWSLNATDELVSTRHVGSGEPVCPDGTFTAGDVRERWRVYLFGTMITGQLLSAVRLPVMGFEVAKAVCAQTLALSELKCDGVKWMSS